MRVYVCVAVWRAGRWGTERQAVTDHRAASGCWLLPRQNKGPLTLWQGCQQSSTEMLFVWYLIVLKFEGVYLSIGASQYKIRDASNIIYLKSFWYTNSKTLAYKQSSQAVSLSHSVVFGALLVKGFTEQYLLHMCNIIRNRSSLILELVGSRSSWPKLVSRQ